MEKYLGLREKIWKAWKFKATVVPVVIRALRAVTPMLQQTPKGTVVKKCSSRDS